MTPEEVSAVLHSAEMFRGVAPALVRKLADDVAVTTLQAGQVLVREGDSNDRLFLLVSGQLRVTRQIPGSEPKSLRNVHPGDTVCEMGILSDDAATTTVQAARDSETIALSRTAFDRFTDAHPEAALHVVESLSRRLQKHRLTTALHVDGVFAALDPDALADLESNLEMSTLYGGEVLFRQGDPGDSIYVVINGRVRVIVTDDEGREDVVAELGPGEIVGEMALVTGEPRAATVIAVRDTHVARLTKEAFDRFVKRHPSWAVQMVGRKLAQRLKEANSGVRRPKTHISTIAVVPVHFSSPATAFCRRLAVALSPFGSCVHLASRGVDEHLGRPGIAQTYERDGRNIRMAEWLNNQESEHNYVLYEADPFLSPWTERCIRQADHVLLVAEGTADPARGEIEKELLDRGAKRSLGREWLVLVHGQEEPSGTGRWLDVRSVDRHYHVRLGNAATFDRLARLLTGRAIGLTLGGGFARGLAHIGVFRAFEEFGIPIDAIGSASMGAMLASLWNMGWDRDRMMREVCSACGNHFGDWTFPFVAFKRGGKFSENVRRLLGDIQIEDLWTPFFCTSANLNRSELKVHTRGSLAKAVLASTRAPGVFPPIVYEGELHVDGGVINNVPVDLMKDFCHQGLTIGVDVAPPHPLKPVRDYGDAISGWGSFWKRCNPFSKDHLYTPSILLVLIRTLEYTGIANRNERIKYADIFMRPDMLKFRRTDFHLATEIAQAGYDCARADLLQHREKLRETGPR